MPPSRRRPPAPDLPPHGGEGADHGAVLHVGVVGHRRLERSDPPALRDAAARLFGLIRRRAEDAAGAGVRIRCLTSLAEGADTVLGEAALAAGATLLCPLPFRRDVYARDFVRAEARAAFEALLGRAEAVVEMDGSPDDPEAYLRAGRLLLAWSELIVAIWDGRPERGPGGTGQIVREARRAGHPVLVIGDAPPHGATLLGDEGSTSAEAGLTAWFGRRAARLGCRP